MTRAPARRRRTGRGGRPGRVGASRASRRGPVLFLLALALLGVAIIAFGLAGPGPKAAGAGPTTVVLPPGSGVSGVAQRLARARVIRSATLFEAAALASGAAHRLQAGEYAFAPRASLLEVLARIRRGEVVRHFVTVPEGLASIAVARLLLDDPTLAGRASPPPEGSILPETYQVRRGEARAAVLARMQAAQDQLLARLWPERAPGLPYRDPQEAVALASIVEKETALPAERAHVAAVFLNRLRRGMPLGSDPTVIYGLTRGLPLGHGLTVSELARPTPWNTYKVAGLPPTPIANPGKASLEAALHPLASDDLYFVADGSGGHAFAATLEAHQRNVAHWRQIEHAPAQRSG